MKKDCEYYDDGFCTQFKIKTRNYWHRNGQGTSRTGKSCLLLCKADKCPKTQIYVKRYEKEIP